MNLKPFSKPRFIADEPPEFRPQRIRQRVGKSREQHPGIRICSNQEDRPMQCDDGFPSAGRTRHPRWTAVVALNQSTLRWMKENRPFVPGVVERALQFLYIGHHAEAALGVGMRERIGSNGYGLGDLWCDAGRQIQQRLGSLARQVIRQFQQRVLIGAADIGQPFGRHTVPQQLVFRDAGEQRWLRRRDLVTGGCSTSTYFGNDDLLHRLPNFHELRRAGLGVGFELPPFGPLIRVVVMTDIAQQQAGLGPYWPWPMPDQRLERRMGPYPLR